MYIIALISFFLFFIRAEDSSPNGDSDAGKSKFLPGGGFGMGYNPMGGFGAAGLGGLGGGFSGSRYASSRSTTGIGPVGYGGMF